VCVLLRLLARGLAVRDETRRELAASVAVRQRPDLLRVCTSLRLDLQCNLASSLCLRPGPKHTWHSWILDPGSEVAGTRSDKCGVYCVWMDGAAAASGSGHSSCTSLDETRRDESRSITSLYYFSILLYPDTSLYVSIVSIRVYTCLYVSI